LTVTPVVGVPTGTLLMTLTRHVSVLPPPVATPLHWSTEVTCAVGDVATAVVQLAGRMAGVTPAAARHATVVTLEDFTPVGLSVFSTVTVQVTSWPAVEPG
jgi:hypothetical protein